MLVKGATEVGILLHRLRYLGCRCLNVKRNGEIRTTDPIMSRPSFAFKHYKLNWNHFTNFERHWMLAVISRWGVILREVTSLLWHQAINTLRLEHNGENRFWLKFHWSLLLGIKLALGQHWFRYDQYSFSEGHWPIGPVRAFLYVSWAISFWWFVFTNRSDRLGTCKVGLLIIITLDNNSLCLIFQDDLQKHLDDTYAMLMAQSEKLKTQRKKFLDQVTTMYTYKYNTSQEMSA